MKQYCDRCSFKFESNSKGRPAKICGPCRKLRDDKWRNDQAAKNVKKDVGDEGKIDAH